MRRTPYNPLRVQLKLARFDPNTGKLRRPIYGGGRLAHHNISMTTIQNFMAVDARFVNMVKSVDEHFDVERKLTFALLRRVEHLEKEQTS